MTTWLLLICLGGASYCDSRGGVSPVLVTEVQCRAALAADKNIYGWCISPTGEVSVKQAR